MAKPKDTFEERNFDNWRLRPDHRLQPVGSKHYQIGPGQTTKNKFWKGLTRHEDADGRVTYHNEKKKYKVTDHER